MSGKKKKLHEKGAEEEKESTGKSIEVVQTENVMQEKTETSSVESIPVSATVAEESAKDKNALPTQMQPQEPVETQNHVQTQEPVQTQNHIQSQEHARTQEYIQQPQTDQYAQLEAQLRTLRAESEKIQKELQKLRDRRGSLERRLYRELLDSEVLGQVAACYVESQGKKELYGNIRQFLEDHAAECDSIRAELRASRERSRSFGVSSLACATGILSVAGIVYAAAGMAAGAVIVLFLVLIALSGHVWVNAEKTSRIGGCAEYLLTVIEDIENSKKL